MRTSVPSTCLSEGALVRPEVYYNIITAHMIYLRPLVIDWRGITWIWDMKFTVSNILRHIVKCLTTLLLWPSVLGCIIARVLHWSLIFVRSCQNLYLSHKHHSSLHFILSIYFFCITDSHTQCCFTTWPVMKTKSSVNKMSFNWNSDFGALNFPFERC